MSFTQWLAALGAGCGLANTTILWLLLRKRREAPVYVPGPMDRWMDAETDRMRNTVGQGRCAACGELATPEDSGRASHGSIEAGCPNGHRWTVTCS